MVQVWGQTLDRSKPSIRDIAAGVAAQLPSMGTGKAAGAETSSSNACTGSWCDTSSSTTASGAAAAPQSSAAAVAGIGGSSQNADSNRQQQANDSGTTTGGAMVQGQTFLVLEYCDKGCLQVSHFCRAGVD